MKLEDQVCSLELAERLKKLGVEQKSIFSWARQDGFKKWGLELSPCYDEHKRTGRSYYSAFTVAEIGEMLPTEFYWEDSSEFVYLRIQKNSKGYIVSYFDYDDQWFDWYSTEDSKEANARAKMLIYLLENNLLQLK